MIKVLVIDDSSFMRAMISRVIASDPELEVIGQACNPMEAREAIKRLNPDVLTLDVEMPGMSGLEFLERLMRLRPTPVIMVSSLTRQGAEVSLRALELGAFDCIAKPQNGAAGDLSRLPTVIHAAKSAKIRGYQGRSEPPLERRPSSEQRVLAVGASTGGVEALLTIFARFPRECPPTVITQHMPASFTASFANRLDRACAARVEEATDGAILSQGRVYLAPGGETHLAIAGQRNGPWHCRLVRSDPVNGHRPSVDVLFRSVAAVARDKAVGLLLTGMGRDGAQGLLAMREAGGRTLGQDEASCVVYGMPKAAFELGAVQRQVSLHAAADVALAESCDENGAATCRPPRI